jgi:2',3'-cyclic-nucleotide 2'-phosphodiesterase (5'-nucleotidase family)
VMSLTSEFPEAAVFIAGHTHQLVPSRLTNGALLTQADHFGIYAGRVDLTFDRESKKLLNRQANCELMDSRVRLDHTVLSRAKSQLDESNAALAEPIGELADTLRARGRPGTPCDIEQLIGAAVTEALRERQVTIDGVFHGVFDENGALFAGKVTINDVWRVIPYENFLVTALLMPEEIRAVMEEAYASHEARNLMGFEIVAPGRGFDRRIVSMSLSDGRRLERDRRYVIAFNSFDSRSGGYHFMKLRAFLERPETNCTFHPVQTRDALIEYFRHHHVVRRITSAAQTRPLAA